MEVFNEYALLIAVAIPVGVVGLLNLILAATGESGTLLLPGMPGRWPSVDMGETPAEAAPAAPAHAEAEPEEFFRKAA